MQRRLTVWEVGAAISLIVGVHIKSLTKSDSCDGSFEDHFGLGNVTMDEHINLSSARKELSLLSQLKLGISVQHIQQLMEVSKTKEPSGVITVLDSVLVPKLNGATHYHIPQCESCNVLRAKQRKPKVVQNKVVNNTEGAISQDKYQVGNFVSICQYVVKDHGHLPTGYI